jgi:regulatory protein
VREALDAVLDDLADAGLQSDARRAEALVRGALARGHGPLRIRRDLAAAGLDADLAEDALPADDGGWAEELDALVLRRFGEAPPADAREWARRARFLAGRGFPEGLVRRRLGPPPPEGR